MQHLVVNNVTALSEENKCAENLFALYSRSARVHQTHSLLGANAARHCTKHQLVHKHKMCVTHIQDMGSFDILGNPHFYFAVVS